MSPETSEHPSAETLGGDVVRFESHRGRVVVADELPLGGVVQVRHLGAGVVVARLGGSVIRGDVLVVKNACFPGASSGTGGWLEQTVVRGADASETASVERHPKHELVCRCSRRKVGVHCRVG